MASKRVVILCRDETIGSATSTWLRDAGHSVDLTIDGASAAQAIARRIPDVFITDDIVPRQGVEASILRVGSEHPTVKIIALCRDEKSELGLARAMGAIAVPAGEVFRRHLLNVVDA